MRLMSSSEMHKLDASAVRSLDEMVRSFLVPDEFEDCCAEVLALAEDAFAALAFLLLSVRSALHLSWVAGVWSL